MDFERLLFGYLKSMHPGNRAVGQLQQQVMKHRDDFPLWVQYKKARNDFCSAIRKAKKQVWRSFMEDASNTDGMMRVARATLQHRTPQMGHLKKRDGNYTQSREEVLDTLMDEFFPKLPPIAYVAQHEVTNLFSPLKLQTAIKSFKKGKSPGPDGMGAEVFQNLDGSSLGRLSLLYNVSLSLGYVPKRWRGGQSCPHSQGG